ncbi:protein transport protein Sec31A isoform X6 [Hydra vulgaris]|uniref:Protein transport protein Sec31A isoform X6 n=1 Tax=Hydra vulgaris TaxID=6087 RepID=A0ABM4D5D7_HYDVU
MNIKQINRTANVAWSPKEQYPVYLVAGTAAQQLDATFNTSATLEIYHVDIENNELDMPVVGSLDIEQRFHKLLWSEFGFSSEYSNGLIVGGTDSGDVCVIDASAVISRKYKSCNVHTLSDHTGPVQALDINKFQSNLIASGSSSSEIFIWDLKHPEQPLSPGTKTTPLDQISCLAWNNQVQHILASSTPTGRVVIWDLKKSEPIIKIGDQSAMFHYKSIAWHPDVSTQILISNEDDRYPVIQMWDLRFASSPIKVLEGHSRGILSLAWCPQDSDLVMSCGKDNRILCWNPNSQLANDIVYELPTMSQWTSDVSWCPRIPGIIASSSFDGHVTISSVMGGSHQVQRQQQHSQISDSFGIQKEDFTQNLMQQPTTVIVQPLKKPPKWMRRPCGACFAFGGKIVSFGTFDEKKVYISQVVTENELLIRSHELESSLISGNLLEYCEHKISVESAQNEKLLWQFLKSNLENEPRMEFLKLLGYDPLELAQKISALSHSEVPVKNETIQGINPTELASKIELLKTRTFDNNKKHLESGGTSPIMGRKTPINDGSDFHDDIVTEYQEEQVIKDSKPFAIPTGDDADGLICQALLTGNFDAAVEICFKNNKMADGILLAIAGGPDLFTRTQKNYLERQCNSTTKLISAVVNRDWRNIVEKSNIENWKEALSALVTYSKAEEFSELCSILGSRLEKEIKDYNSALVCYICAGDVESLVACWNHSLDTEIRDHSSVNTELMLQNLIEKVMILKKSTENERYKPAVNQTSNVAEMLCKYALLLSSQGNLQTAMSYLSFISNQAVEILKDRIFHSSGTFCVNPPSFPFERINVTAHLEVSSKTHSNKVHQATLKQQFSPVDPNYSGLYNSATVVHSISTVSNNQSGAYQTPAFNSLTSSTMLNANPLPVKAQYSHQTAFNQQLAENSSSLNQMPNNYLYNPSPQNSNFSSPSPVSKVYNPTIMQPTKTDFAPPPVGAMGYRLNFKTSKPESVNQPSPTLQQSVNFYNPSFQEPALNVLPTLPSNPMAPLNPMIPSNPMASSNPMITSNPMVSSPVQSQPEPIKKEEFIKAPIPKEHMVVQDTFDSIVIRCKNACNNPQTKRKMEDVNRKLDILYDLLRESKVSPSVLSGLHQMVQACQVGNYIVGIQIHTHMISTGNFSEISSFMPGLKTLMQIAGQLKV